MSDYNWVYGNSKADIKESIVSGRSGIMPAFGERLDDLQINFLVAWLTKNQEKQ